MEHLWNQTLNSFTIEKLAIRSKRQAYRKTQWTESLQGLTVCRPHQAAGQRLRISNGEAFLKTTPSLSSETHPLWTQAGVHPAWHARACHMFSRVPSLRLSLIKYSLLSAGGKAVMAETPVWVSCCWKATVTRQDSEGKRTGGFEWPTLGWVKTLVL